MEQLRPELWTWTAPHPDRHEQPVVCSYAVERRETLVLIDPISPPAELLEGRALEVALTCPWHARSAPELDAPEADVESRPAFYPDERVLVFREHGALVFGESWPGGPIPDDWLPEGKTCADYDAWLDDVLEPWAGLLLPTHGDPSGVA
jgi:hypothetical protein